MEALSQPMISANPSEHRQELVERIDLLRRSADICDVKLIVKDKELAAHKAVLAAASPFFLKSLTVDMRESKEHLIRIKLEEVTASDMEDVLQYLYTGNVLVTEENAHNLFVAADYLLLPSLKKAASVYLIDVLTIENCVFNYYFANKYQCTELKEKAREMINSDFSAVMETDDFLSLDIKQVMEWVSSDDITVNAEEEVFNGIVKWVSHNRSEREVEFPGLLRQVRLVSISQNILLNELLKEELVAKNTELCLNLVLDAMRLMASATDEQCLQQPRKCLEVHIDSIFVCGGKRAMCYFPEQDVWYKLSNMLFLHHDIESLIQYRSKIYFAGSISDSLSASNLIMEFYTPALNSWGASQVDITFTSTAVLRGHLYTTENWEYHGIYRYDPEKDHSNELKKPPITPPNKCVVTDEQYIYLIGGRTFDKATYTNFALSTTHRLDPSADDHEWEEVAPLCQARYNAFGAAMNGKVYIAGGYQGRDTLNTCEVYNPLTNEWQLMPSLKVPRECGSMVCHDGRLYVLGGVNRSSRILSVEIFDSEQNEWKEKSVIPVDCLETSEEKREEYSFKACFARLCKEVINKLEPLNT